MTSSEPRFRVLKTAQEQEWKEVLAKVVQHDFHHLPQYHRVAEQAGEGTGHLFVYQELDCTIALPLLLRPVDAREPGGWQDATSVYGYCGPVASHDALPEGILRNFQAALTEALVERRVVSVFSRLHPLMAQHEILAGIGECPVNGTTISIDLTLADAEQQAAYSKSCRASLRKLHAHGFVGLHDVEKRYLPQFIEVYQETMQRVGAQDSYRFGAAHFERFVRELGAAAHLFVALKDGEVAAATLCTICDGIVQDYLGGTRTGFLKFSPDRLIVDMERRWATKMGARAFHLGGGVGGSAEDSVFRYKSGFSHRRHVFRTWRWVIDPSAYEALCAQKASGNQARGLAAASPTFFPEYRAPTVAAAPPAPEEIASADSQRGVAVFGAGGHAKVVISTIIASGLSVGAIFDEDTRKWGQLARGVRVSEPKASISQPVVLAIGGNAMRMKIAGDWEFDWKTVVHPTACLDSTVKLGAGTVVFAGAVIQPDAVLGKHIIVNTGATIDHECTIGDFAHIGPGVHLAGAVKVGEGAFMGIGSVALPGVTIGKWTTVGAGAVVTRDLPDGVVAYGVPAKPKTA